MSARQASSGTVWPVCVAPQSSSLVPLASTTMAGSVSRSPLQPSTPPAPPAGISTPRAPVVWSCPRMLDSAIVANTGTGFLAPATLGVGCTCAPLDMAGTGCAVFTTPVRLYVKQDSIGMEAGVPPVLPPLLTHVQVPHTSTGRLVSSSHSDHQVAIRIPSPPLQTPYQSDLSDPQIHLPDQLVSLGTTGTLWPSAASYRKSDDSDPHAPPPFNAYWKICCGCR